jgi:hypothetical protein
MVALVVLDTVVVQMLKVVSFLEQRTQVEVVEDQPYKVVLVVQDLLRLDTSFKANF